MIITDEERRARLVARHHLGCTAATVDKAVAALVAIHSSDPASPYLGVWARMDGFKREDLENALFVERSLWRLHAMRRTLFVVPTHAAAIFDAAVGRTIAARERQRLTKWLAAAPPEPTVRLAELEKAVMKTVADGGEYGAGELVAAVPGLKTEISVGSGKWAARVRISSRLLYILAMEGKVVRARPAGTWRSSQYRWASTSDWFDNVPEGLDPESARAALLTRYLDAFGPASMADIRWWTGWPLREAAPALAAVGVTTVTLEGGAEGFVREGDAERTELSSPTVTLLPALDSTAMGWKERSWYMGDHVGALFDRNGNVGPTIWLDGRVVGGWGQRPDAEVAYRLLEDVGGEAADRVRNKAHDLTAWLEGVTVTPRFRTPLERELAS